MNFKKSLTEEELGVILAPQLRLFLSVDVVGSTAFKHLKALHGESKPWLKFIHGFYTGFPEMCWRRVAEVQTDAAPGTILAKPYLWKALGDELIFSVPLQHPSYVRPYLQAFRLTLVEAIEHWACGEKPLPISFKGTAWLAGFPVFNSAVPLDVDKPLSPESELERQEAIWWGKEGNSVPSQKRFLTDVKQGVVPATMWFHDEAGHNGEAKNELREVLSESPELFITPKPTRLIRRIIQLATDKDSLILDSFAGLGTTGHAVLKQNAEGGGNRRFILVEMEENIAQNITAERVRRVSQGYDKEKGETVRGLGSGFRFATLGNTLFDETGAIRQDVKFRELAEFVFFHEMGSPLPAGWKKSPLLGTVDGRAVYLLYNGILADKTPDGGNVLTAATLAALPSHSEEKVIYAAACRLGASRLDREGIRFKQTPYSIRVD